MRNRTPRRLAAIVLLPGVGLANAGADDMLLAFCRPAVDTMARTCVCSVEQVEQPLTRAEFLRHLAAHRAAGALSTAELSAFARDADRTCDRGVQALPGGSPNVLTGRPQP
jgi:hypothetical protein